MTMSLKKKESFEKGIFIIQSRNKSTLKKFRTLEEDLLWRIKTSIKNQIIILQILQITG